MNEEVTKILNMVQEGKISVEEAENLIAVINAPETNAVKSVTKGKYSKLKVNVLVKDRNDNLKDTVNVNLPLKLVKLTSRFIDLMPKEAKTELNEKGIDLTAEDINELIEQFENGEIEGDLVNVDSHDEDKNEHSYVRIYVE